MWGNSPVLARVIFVWVVLFVVSKECVKRDALSEILGNFEAANVFEEVEVAVSVDAGSDKSVPMDALQFDV